jgi:TRAP-type C4-dicarboxylate transport system permease small subunit
VTGGSAAPVEPGAGGEPTAAQPGPLRPLGSALAVINGGMLALGMIALLAASCILTYSVFSRYFLKAATDWQDETAVFCIVGAVFLSGAYVQSLRGHIGISAIASLLPPSVDRIRRLVVDLASLAFCAFFAWKSWTLWHEAWTGGYTTSSTWAAPLWIPYGMMSMGMTLLVLQILLQFTAALANREQAR